MKFRLGLILTCLIALAGCATTAPVARLPAERLWQDAAFNYNGAQGIESKQSLFELDPALAASLAASQLQTKSVERRLDYLVSLLFHEDRIRFTYAAGHSTGATETWNNKRGDCLSLTILTYAAAQALGIPARMQEVRVPVALDRRGGIDFLSGHVNVFILNSSAIQVNGRSFGSGGIVLDFEPQVGSRQHGTALSDDEILARFYNNRAAEYLAQRNDDKAYAYFKAAIVADPQFGAAYSNLAQLYTRHKLTENAEALLLHAIALKDNTDSPLRALHTLMLAQGRTAEALKYAALLQQRQDQDPYYWLGVGLDHLQQSRFDRAISALEKAEALTTGFNEIHRYLAVAYWRNGQQSAANKQLALLETMDRNDPGTVALSKKLQRNPPQGSVH